MSEAASSSCRNTRPTSIRSRAGLRQGFKTSAAKGGSPKLLQAIPSDACGKILAQHPPAECAAYLKNAGYA